MKMDPQETLRIQRLEVCNAQGDVAITLGVEHGSSPYIRLYDRWGCERLVLSLSEGVHEPQIGLLDKDGKVLVGMGVNKDLGQGINVFDREGRSVLIIAVASNGKAIVKLDENA